MLNTPVLFLIFNRPDTTQQVFDEIRKAQPAQLFVAADGPRKDRPEDQELCKKTRNIIREVDWECRVFTRFHEENLGCKIAVSSAIDWFFSNVDEGIILEDDCVPDPSFFPFCEKMLEHFRYDTRVMMVAGTNNLFNRIEIPETYYFSRYYSIWGWATWRRAWKFYDIRMRKWPHVRESGDLSLYYPDRSVQNYLKFEFDLVAMDYHQTWDFQWFFSCIMQHGLAVVPKYNLIANIGIQGIHTAKSSKLNKMPLKSIDFHNIIHPEYVFPNSVLDRITFESVIDKSLRKKISILMMKFGATDIGKAFRKTIRK
jgi:hypothetical protein